MFLSVQSEVYYLQQKVRLDIVAVDGHIQRGLLEKVGAVPFDRAVHGGLPLTPQRVIALHGESAT